jgi:hypothetical protein
MIEFYGGYQVYSESGVDLGSLRRNLCLSPQERLENNFRMLPFLDALRFAKSPSEAEVPERPTRYFMFDGPALLRQLATHRVEYVLIRDQGRRYLLQPEPG